MDQCRQHGSGQIFCTQGMGACKPFWSWCIFSWTSQGGNKTAWSEPNKFGQDFIAAAKRAWRMPQGTASWMPCLVLKGASCCRAPIYKCDFVFIFRLACLDLANDFLLVSLRFSWLQRGCSSTQTFHTFVNVGPATESIVLNQQ